MKDCQYFIYVTYNSGCYRFGLKKDNFEVETFLESFVSDERGPQLASGIIKGPLFDKMKNFVHTDKTVDNCKDLCCDQKNCTSFDYDELKSRCGLVSVNIESP